MVFPDFVDEDLCEFLSVRCFETRDEVCLPGEAIYYYQDTVISTRFQKFDDEVICDVFPWLLWDRK
jgi:hypothetical protein